MTTLRRVIRSKTVLNVPMPRDARGSARRDRYIKTWALDRSETTPLR